MRIASASILIVALTGLMYLPVTYATATGGSVSGGTTVNNNSGEFVKLTPPLANPNGDPNSVGGDNFDTYNLYVFDEEQNVLLEEALGVDDVAGTGRPFTSNTLPAGSTFSSHYVFYDPPGTSGTTLMTGCLEFDSDVAAVISSKNRLDASDFLANTDVNYVSVTDRGLELSDSFTFTGNQVCVNLNASTPGDYIRVITNFSPAAYELNSYCSVIKARGRRFSILCF